MVGFDTTILPGREGSITEQIDIAKIHGGEFTKCATVTCNAKNKPDFRLCLKGVVKEPLHVNPQYIALKKDMNKKQYSLDLLLSSEKADLVVKNVSFVTNSQPASSPAGQNTWQNKLPVYFTVSVKKAAKPKDDGEWDYVVTISIASDFAENQSGDFVISTNHPDALETKIPGMIEASLKK